MKKNTKESGITLIALVITIIIVTILASIMELSGAKTVNLAKYNHFVNELQIIQTKVEELSDEDKTEINGISPISNDQKKKLSDNLEVANIIYNNKTEDGKKDVENTFYYLNKNQIKDKLGIEEVKRDYYINIKYKFVVYLSGYKYDGQTYYMLQQTGSTTYNVDYQNANSNTGTFQLDVEKQANDKWKISVINIEHEGYVSNWNVKYKISGEETWKTAEGLDFYVTKPGYYIVKVTFGNENDKDNFIDLGTQNITCE